MPLRRALSVLATLAGVGFLAMAPILLLLPTYPDELLWTLISARYFLDGGRLVYLAPVMTALFAWGISQLAGWLAWIIMAVMFQPILRFYRLSPLWGLALPLIGVFYAAFTLESAFMHWAGKGGMWKGRAQANVEKAGGQT